MAISGFFAANANGSYTNWQPNTGTRVDCVAANDGDTSYVYGTKASNYFSMFCATPDAAAVTQVGLQSIHRWVNNPPFGWFSFHNLRINTTDCSGTEYGETATYTTRTTDPIGRPGGGSWSPADLPITQIVMGSGPSSNTGEVGRYTYAVMKVTYDPPAGGMFNFGFGFQWATVVFGLQHLLGGYLRADVVSLHQTLKREVRRRFWKELQCYLPQLDEMPRIIDTLTRPTRYCFIRS